MQFAVDNKSPDSAFLLSAMLVSFTINIPKKAKSPIWSIRSVSISLQNTMLASICERMCRDSEAVISVDLTGNPNSMRDGIV